MARLNSLMFTFTAALIVLCAMLPLGIEEKTALRITWASVVAFQHEMLWQKMHRHITRERPVLWTWRRMHNKTVQVWPAPKDRHLWLG